MRIYEKTIILRPIAALTRWNTVSNRKKIVVNMYSVKSYTEAYQDDVHNVSIYLKVLDHWAHYYLVLGVNSGLSCTKS